LTTQPASGVAPDGSPVALYLALPGHEEAALILGAIEPGAAVLELGCGVGRVTRHLAAAGHPVTGVDNSAEMLAHLQGIERVEPVLADIATLELSPRRWPVVVMASHLVNDDCGAEFLATAARHLEGGGSVLIERHEPGWTATVQESTTERHGVTIAIGEIDRPTPGSLRATMVYDVDGCRYKQRFTAHEVDDDRLADMAAAEGLRIDKVLNASRTWVRLT
jgi:ubiquinone/menaquinone biosynthesis C-methylase UbiE